MISVAEAKRIIKENIISLPFVKLPLHEAAGGMLAADVFAPVAIPPFDQSAMDGYAFNYEGWQKNKNLVLQGEIAAGDQASALYSPDSAIRIFTGAPIPPGADTVVMQERVEVRNSVLIIEDPVLQKGNAIRLKASEINTGELALEKESYLSAAAIGLLASMGISEVFVISKPSISIIVTGNELQKPGENLMEGKIFESNSFALVAALQQLNLKDMAVYWSKDQPDQLELILKNALATSDIVLLTGGVSVGDYDFVLQAATACGVQKLFHRIAQKPGKPLYFGKKENKIVFGLPGNPASVLTCFYEYVRPALHLLNPALKDLEIRHVPVRTSYLKAAGISHFLKGHYDGTSVYILNAQESYRLRSFAKSNCLIYFDEQTTHCPDGTLVEIHLID